MVEEPPAAVKKQMELYRQVIATGDMEKQGKLMTQLLDISADQFYTIGICYEPKQYGIATNRMQNVPDNIPFLGYTRALAPTIWTRCGFRPSYGRKEGPIPELTGVNAALHALLCRAAFSPPGTPGGFVWIIDFPAVIAPDCPPKVGSKRGPS